VECRQGGHQRINASTAGKSTNESPTVRVRKVLMYRYILSYIGFTRRSRCREIN
jgi:hypothetical protein